MTQIERLREIIDNSEYLVFFGGAGVSTASGIPDFRSSNGIYNEKYGNIPIERIISHSFFMSNPEIFFKIYKEKLVFKDALPNDCHKTLKVLEDKGILKAVITQNIDNLHQKAGSRNVLELHGSTYRNYCMKCHKPHDIDKVLDSDGVPKCTCGGTIKPDVVLYEESLDYNTIMDTIDHLLKADTLIIGGTSLSVYPAASFIDYFKGKNLVIINKDTTMKDTYATLVIHDDIAKVFRELNYLGD